MKNRKAMLYEDYRKLKDPINTVTVLHIGTIGDEEGSYIAASVEKENGEVIEVGHDRLKFVHKETDNPYLPDDWVEIKSDIKDSYEETWHPKGSKLQIKYLAADGEGLMFYSNLGTHWSNVKRVPKPKT